MEPTLEELKYPIGPYKPPTEHTPKLHKQWISTLEALPSWLDVCIENLDEYQLQTSYRPGGWTVQQVIHHMADSHMNAYVRIKLALTEDNPTIKPYKEEEWAKLSDSQTVPVNVSVTLLHAMHRRMVALLKDLQPGDWTRTYYHPEYKREVPMWEVVAMYAWHSRHHTEQIKRLRERMNW